MNALTIVLIIAFLGVCIVLFFLARYTLKLSKESGVNTIFLEEGDHDNGGEIVLKISNHNHDSQAFDIFGFNRNVNSVPDGIEIENLSGDGRDYKAMVLDLALYPAKVDGLSIFSDNGLSLIRYSENFRSPKLNLKELFRSYPHDENRNLNNEIFLDANSIIHIEIDGGSHAVIKFRINQRYSLRGMLQASGASLPRIASGRGIVIKRNEDHDTPTTDTE